MKISELPPEVRAKALAYQKNAHPVYSKNSNSILHAFNLDNTDEGHKYWENWDNCVLVLDCVNKEKHRIHIRNFAITVELAVVYGIGFLIILALIFK